jgi:hypothetical protein
MPCALEFKILSLGSGLVMANTRLHLHTSNTSRAQFASPSRRLFGICVMTIQLNDELDSFIWYLTASGMFSVKSLYADFMNDHTKR